MKKILSVILMLGCVLMVSAEEKPAFTNEIRVGIGDPIMPILWATSSTPTHKNKAYGPGEIFVEYTYNISEHWAVACQLSMLPLVFTDQYEELGITYKDKYYDFHFSLVPKLRYTYWQNDLVGLYSSLGIGASYDYMEWRPERHDLGAVFDVTALGVSVGRNHWYGSFELGAMVHLFDAEEYVPVTKVISASIGYRF